MRFRIEGKEYEFDDTTLLVREARLIKTHAKMGLRAFAAGLQEGDPDAIAVMVLITKRRVGEVISYGEMDTFNLASLQMLDDEEEPDPLAGLAIPNDVVSTPG